MVTWIIRNFDGRCYGKYQQIVLNNSLITRYMGPTWDPSGGDRTQVGPMLAPWTLLSGFLCCQTQHDHSSGVKLMVSSVWLATMSLHANMDINHRIGLEEGKSRMTWINWLELICSQVWWNFKLSLRSVLIVDKFISLNIDNVGLKIQAWWCIYTGLILGLHSNYFVETLIFICLFWFSIFSIKNLPDKLCF